MEVAEWFINNPFTILLCFAAVAMATNDDKIDYIVKRVDEIHKTITSHDVRISKLEEDKIRREEREKYEEEREESRRQGAELKIYRFIAKNIFKIVVAIIITVLGAWFLLRLGL